MTDERRPYTNTAALAMEGFAPAMNAVGESPDRAELLPLPERSVGRM